MIVQFTVKNFMSFKEEATFSMVAANRCDDVDESKRHIINFKLNNKDVNLLKTAVVYGANASGKSNLVKAMIFMSDVICYSVKSPMLISRSSHLHYLFDDYSRSEPMMFELIFIWHSESEQQDVKYRYGFELNKGNVESEWLFMQPMDAARESYCFKREGGDIQVNSRVMKGTAGLVEKTRLDALFLTVAAQFNVAIALELMDYFTYHFVIKQEATSMFTMQKYQDDPEMHQRMIEFVKLMDLGILDINIKDVQLNAEEQRAWEERLRVNQIPESKPTLIYSAHNVYNKNREVVGIQPLPFEMESYGTNKLFMMLGEYFWVLMKGGVLVFDEFGTGFHSLLAHKMVETFQKFQNKDIRSQLVVLTHDTSLLRRDLYRRDEVWFTEKNEYGESDLYSLAEYKINNISSVRNDAVFNKDYLQGKYGAIPYFGNVDQFIEDYGKKE